MTRRKKNNVLLIVPVLLLVLIALFFLYSRVCIHEQRANIKKHMNLQEDQKQDTATKQLDITDSINISNMISKEKLLGKISAVESDKMVIVPDEYASRGNIYMHAEAFEAFLKMYEDAKKDGINLQIMSGFRSFNHQKRIWENKWNGRQLLHGNIRATDIADPKKRALEILKFSAMPGTSRHHWGTDIDLNSLNNSYFESGYGKKVYSWLRANAGKYGFCQPYTSKGDNRNSGYEEEKWHWSFLPVASGYLNSYKESVDYSDINGFDGCETATQLNVIEKYVLSINSECME